MDEFYGVFLVNDKLLIHTEKYLERVHVQDLP